MTGQHGVQHPTLDCTFAASPLVSLYNLGEFAIFLGLAICLRSCQEGPCLSPYRPCSRLSTRQHFLACSTACSAHDARYCRHTDRRSDTLSLSCQTQHRQTGTEKRREPTLQIGSVYMTDAISNQAQDALQYRLQLPKHRNCAMACVMWQCCTCC